MGPFHHWARWKVGLTVIGGLLLFGVVLSLLEKVAGPPAAPVPSSDSPAAPGGDAPFTVSVVEGSVVQIDVGLSRHRFGVGDETEARSIAECMEEGLSQDPDDPTARDHMRGLFEFCRETSNLNGG